MTDLEQSMLDDVKEYQVELKEQQKSPKASGSKEKSKQKAKLAHDVDKDGDVGIIGSDPTLGDLDDSALDAFMDAWDNILLPEPPKVPGYHTFWASTTNNWDAIPLRLRGGYTFVAPSEVPDFHAQHYQTRMNSGSFGSGEVISVNEMVAMKCPERLYQKRLLKYHHKMPFDQQKGIVDSMRAISDKIGVHQTATPLEQGMLEIEAETQRSKQTPEFFSNTKRQI